MNSYNKSIIAMLTAAVIISTASVWVKVADVAPSVSGFYRMFIGGVVLVILCYQQKLRMWSGWNHYKWLFFAALSFAFDLYFWHRSIIYVGPGLATVLGNFQVFFMALAGYLFYQEKITKHFIIGLFITIAGLFLLVGIHWSELSSDYRLGVIYGILTAISYTFFMLSLRYAQSVKNGITAMANLGLMSLSCAFMMYLVVFFEGNDINLPNIQAVISMLILGVFCQVLGWLLITRSMPHLPTSIVGVVLLLQPALSMLWDVIFFDRPTDLQDLIGLFMVLAGVYLATIKKKSH